MNRQARADAPRRLLQICPHDTPPFGKLCAAIEQAARQAELSVTTVILGPPAAEPRTDFIYLGCEDVRRAGTLLRQHPDVGVERDYWDLVLCHRYASLRAALKLRVANRRIAVLAHEFDMLKSWRRRLFRLVFARKVNFGGVSPVVSAQLARHTRMGFVLPNILDLEKFDAQLLSRADALRRLGLEPGPLTIGVVGRLHYKKRPELALAAFQHFAREHPQARLVFVGGDPATHQHLLAEGVHLTGPVHDAAQAFRAFDVLLHTGNVESFGMVVLEAMAAGVPVVVAAGGGPEYVLGKLGTYPDSDDAAGYAQALAHAVDRDVEAYRQAARERCERLFSTTALAASLGAMVKFVDQTETDPFGPML
ncbi:MAG: glycosyltransferase family 4 protein [Pseudomonadales bacterium]